MADRRSGIDLGPEARRSGFYRVNPRWVQAVLALLIVVIAAFLAGAQWQWQRGQDETDPAPCPFYDGTGYQHVSA